MTTPKPTPINNRATRRRADKLKVDPAAIVAPIMTLDVAQRVGVQAAIMAVQAAKKDVETANERLSETLKMSASVFSSVGLDPDKNYPMDADGRVFPAEEGKKK